jgi:hypothetical protein
LPRVETHRHTEVIVAPVDVCFDVLVDFDKYPEFFRMISAAHIESADVAAGKWVVAYELDAILRTIHYTLAYDSERPHRLTWKLAGGDLKDIQGSYELVELEPGLTEATCTQGLDIGLWVPGPIRRAFEQSALADSVRELKTAAQQRAGTAA